MIKTVNLLASLSMEIPALEANAEGKLRGGFSTFDVMTTSGMAHNTNCNCNCGVNCDCDTNENCNCNCSTNPPTLPPTLPPTVDTGTSIPVTMFGIRDSFMF